MKRMRVSFHHNCLSNGHFDGILLTHLSAVPLSHAFGFMPGIRTFGNESTKEHHHFGDLAFLPDRDF